jgi:hypothetical protein
LKKKERGKENISKCLTIKKERNEYITKAKKRKFFKKIRRELLE